MTPFPRHAILLRLNLGLNFSEGIWVLWHFLKSPSEPGSIVFVQYSLPRLFLLSFVLVLMAAIVFLLAETIRLDWTQRGAGTWLMAVLEQTVSFWVLLGCSAGMLILAFMPESTLGSLVPYRDQVLPVLLWLGISSTHWLLSWLSLRWDDIRTLQRHTATLMTAGLMIVFCLSRVVYDRLGFVFQSDGIYDYWQMIDPFLLQTDLWRSLLYLHSQPPILNLSTGLVLQFFPSANESVFHAMYFLSGLVLAWSVYQLGLGLKLQAWLSLTGTFLFAISPPVVLYEHWLFYTYPVAAALTFAGVALHRFVHTQKFRWGLLFFSLLAFVALLWSLFHLLWMIAIVCTLIYILPDRKKTVLATLIPLVLVTGWYGKNYILFGEFTANTWAGMNFSHPTTLRLTDEERLRMVQTGELSAFAQYSTFDPPESYLQLLPDTPITGIPILDMTKKSIGRVNFHHLVYVETGAYYRRDALRVILAHPTLYLRSVTQSLYIFFHSTSDYDFLGYNRERIPVLETLWNRLFFGQWQTNETLDERTHDISVGHIGWWIIIAFLTALFGAIRHLWVQREAFHDPKNLLIFFMGFNLLYVAVVANMFDLGENNRFRFVVDPFILILFLFFVTQTIFQRYWGSGNGQANSEEASR